MDERRRLVGGSASSAGRGHRDGLAAYCGPENKVNLGVGEGLEIISAFLPPLPRGASRRGNVRELESVIERAVISSPGPALRVVGLGESRPVTGGRGLDARGRPPALPGG